MKQGNINEQALNQEFYYYYNRLSKGQKESMLSMMRSFLGKSGDKTKRISVNQYNKELDEAERRINDGKYTSQEALKEESKKW